MPRSHRALLALMVLLVGVNARANHPNEGTLSLEDLIREASAHNLEVAELKAHSRVLQSAWSATTGQLYPEVSLEGGPLASRFAAEKNSGTAAYAKVEWNLFRGGRDWAQRAKAMQDASLAQTQLDQAVAKVSREVARSYYEMLFILESIAIKEAAIELNENQAKLARTKKNSGFTSEADVIEFELKDATLRSDLKRFLLEKDERARELSLLIGYKNPTAEIVVKGHLVRDSRTPKKSVVSQRLENENLEILEAKVEYEQSQADKVIARAGLLPKLDVRGRYGKIESEGRIVAGADNYEVFLTLNVPLFSGFSSVGEVRSSQARVEESAAVLKRTSAQLRATVDGLYAKLASVMERLDLEEKTLVRSELYYKITIGEYRRGVKNSPDMVVAAERLLEARIRNLSYRKEFYLVRLDIEGLVGAMPNERSLY